MKTLWCRHAILYDGDQYYVDTELENRLLYLIDALKRLYI